MPTPPNESLAKKIRLMRGSVTTVEAAARSGLSREWWSAAERGRSKPQPPKLAQAIRAFGGNLRDIFETAGYDPEPFLHDTSPPGVPDRIEMVFTIVDRLDATLSAHERRMDDIEYRLDELENP